MLKLIQKHEYVLLIPGCLHQAGQGTAINVREDNIRIYWSREAWREK